LRRVLESAKARLELATRGLQRLPARVAAGGHRRLLISRRQQLAQLMSARMASSRARLDAGDRALGHLGPTRVLQRGYSITFLEGAPEPLKDATRIHGGQSMITRLARGEVRSLVSRTTIEPRAVARETVRQPSLFDDATDTGAEPVDDGAIDE
jgi:exonuclease VII large subunit